MEYKTAEPAVKKKIYFLVCFFALIVFIPMIVFAGEATKVYVDNQLGFQIEYPASWKEGGVTGGGVVVIFTKGAINRNIQVIHQEGGEQEAVATLKNLASILPENRELVGKWEEVNGLRAYFQISQWSSIIGSNSAIRLLVPLENDFFLVMGVCPTSQFEELHSLLERCVRSFQVKR